MISISVPVVGGRFTDGFGPRGWVDGLGYLGYHTGQDIAAALWAPIYAPHDGVISRVWWDAFADGTGAGGNMCAVDRGDGIYESRIAHMAAWCPLPVGARVFEGVTIIGYSGMSGAATGPHVHQELLEYGRFVDPMPYYAINQGGAPAPAPAPKPTPEEEDEEMANVYFSANSSSPPLKDGTVRIKKGVIKEGGVTWSNVWERSENATIRRMMDEEWKALNLARSNANLKTPVTGVSGIQIEQMVYGKRIDSRE